MNTFKVRNPHRSFEDMPPQWTAAGIGYGDFEADFLACVTWCARHGSVPVYLRNNFGMSPEPYGIEVSGDRSSDDAVAAHVAHARSVVEPALPHWNWLYGQLKDWDSRVLLLTVLSYRTLGWRFVQMPLDTPAFWDCMASISRAESDGEMLPQALQNCSPYPMSRFAIEGQGGLIDLYSDAFGVFNEFVYSQYNLRSRTAVFSAKQGDVVLDCGACFGGTSLYFADAVGDSGRVVSFEFMPDNLKIFNKNLSMNPALAKRIHLVERPVWRTSGDVMCIEGSGPATQVHMLSEGHGVDVASGGLRVTSATIDETVVSAGLERVDLIKMDIEGAEMMALQGARQTIEKFKPTLAICVYHKLIDFYEIPQFIDSLGLGYSFEFQHSTVHGDETVVFAVSQARREGVLVKKGKFSGVLEKLKKLRFA